MNDMTSAYPPPNAYTLELQHVSLGHTLSMIYIQHVNKKKNSID